MSTVDDVKNLKDTILKSVDEKRTASTIENVRHNVLKSVEAKRTAAKNMREQSIMHIEAASQNNAQAAVLDAQADKLQSDIESVILIFEAQKKTNKAYPMGETFTENQVQKFRAWDEMNNQMITPVDGLDLVNNLVIDASQGWNNIRCFTAPTMPFSGKKDKNGTDIYAGDCLGLMENTVEYLPDSGFTVNGDRPLWMMCDKFEIVGNIYEGKIEK